MPCNTLLDILHNLTQGTDFCPLVPASAEMTCIRHNWFPGDVQMADMADITGMTGMTGMAA